MVLQKMETDNDKNGIDINWHASIWNTVLTDENRVEIAGNQTRGLWKGSVSEGGPVGWRVIVFQ